MNNRDFRLLLYVGNGTRYGRSFYGTQIGTRTRSIEWCHFQWP